MRRRGERRKGERGVEELSGERSDRVRVRLGEKANGS